MDLSMNWVSINVEEIKINFDAVMDDKKTYYIFGDVSIRYENSDNFWVESADIDLYNTENDESENIKVSLYTKEPRNSLIVSVLNYQIHNSDYYNRIISESIMESYNG